LSKLDYIGAGGLTITPKTSKFDILPIKFAIKIWGKLLQVFVGLVKPYARSNMKISPLSLQKYGLMASQN